MRFLSKFLSVTAIAAALLFTFTDGHAGTIQYEIDVENFQTTTVQDLSGSKAFRFFSLLDIPQFSTRSGTRLLNDITLTLQSSFSITSTVQSKSKAFVGTATNTHNTALFGPVISGTIFDPFFPESNPTIPKLNELGVSDVAPFSLDVNDRFTHVTADIISKITKPLIRSQFLGDDEWQAVVRGQHVGAGGPAPRNTFITADDFDISVVAVSDANVSVEYNFTPNAGTAQVENFRGQLGTGSPTTLSQIVDVPNDPFDLTFDYLFESRDSELVVTLGGTEIGRLFASSSTADGFMDAAFAVDGELLGQTGQELAFTLDGPTGSTALLDNINFLGLINGDFQLGSLEGFTAQSSGDGFARALAQFQIGSPTPVPLPPALALFLGALAGLGWFGIGRRRRHVAA